MRHPFLLPPDSAELGRLLLQELLRDYPELLPFFREIGESVDSKAPLPLSAEFLETFGEDLRSILAWRAGPA